jgi:ABC-type transporter MlaC component
MNLSNLCIIFENERYPVRIIKKSKSDRKRCSDLLLTYSIIFTLWLALIVAPVKADDRTFQSPMVAKNWITTEQIAPGEAKKAFDDYLVKLRNGKVSEAIDMYFDAMTYVKLSFSHYLLTLNHNELEDLKKEFVKYMKKITNMPEIKNLKHKITGERINSDGFAEVEYLDAYGTSFEMKHTAIFRKVNGRLLYFDMHREGKSMPKMLGKLYSQYSGEMLPLAFVKALND